MANNRDHVVWLQSVFYTLYNYAWQTAARGPGRKPGASFIYSRKRLSLSLLADGCKQLHVGKSGPTGGGGGHGNGAQLIGVLVRPLRQRRGGGVGALLQRGGAYLAGVGAVHQEARS